MALRDDRVPGLPGRVKTPGLCLWGRTALALSLVLAGAGCSLRSMAVNTIADLFSDPQLAARGQWRRHVHDVIGEHSYCAPAYALSATPGGVTGPAPTLGRDNEAVFRGLLGLTREEYAVYEAGGAFS